MVILLGVAVCGPAHADRVGELTRALRDPSWRVRFQAVVVLGKLGDRRAAPALARVLSDPNETVRGLAAQVLGELGDETVRPALQRAGRDKSAFVRAKARAALARLAPPPSEPGEPSGPLRVAVGGVGAKAHHVSPRLTMKLRQLIEDELRRTPGVTLEGKPLSGFLIDSAITTLTRRDTAYGTEISVEVSMIVGKLPSKAMVMMTSGGATVQAPRDIRPAQEATFQVDALAGAVKGAHENLLAFLRTQQQQQPTAGRLGRR